MSKLAQVLKILSAILLITYPLLVYMGLKYLSIYLLAPSIIIICLIRLSTLKVNLKEIFWISRLILIITIALCFLALLMKSGSWMLCYPVLVNIIMLGIFTYSLFNPPSIIEHFARSQTPDLSAEGVVYTRNLTKIWCAFFVLNGAISLYTIQISIEVWTLYNGLISYILIGSLLAGEWLYRKIVIEK